MTLKVTKMKYQGIDGAKDSFREDETVIFDLVKDVIVDYHFLSKEFNLCPVTMHTMIPLPLEMLVGKNITSERRFIEWLVKKKDIWEIYCQPISEDGNELVVDFYEAWPISNWCLDGSNMKRKRMLYDALLGGENGREKKKTKTCRL